MDMESVKRKAAYYLSKYEWDYAEMGASEKFRQSLRFETESDLDFGVIDFYYERMPGMIIRDARERAKREGLNSGYEWGKRYLNHYAGWCCMVSKSEHPALHTSKAYDILTERLAEECLAGDAE